MIAACSSRSPCPRGWGRSGSSRCSTGPTRRSTASTSGFFRPLRGSQAVQYFYEPFLEAFDPELRKELGVWYTPPEIVQYMVTRVDTVLREELGIADGLADPRVYVLDPCCGTGAYLVEVLQRIAATLREQGGDALLGDDLKRAATERVFGFELFPRPSSWPTCNSACCCKRWGATLRRRQRAGRCLPDQRPHRLGAAHWPQAAPALP